MRFSFLKGINQRVLVLGNVDTGKTFLCFRFLQEVLKFRKEVGLVCADLGQSAVGPPGCVSFKIFTKAPFFKDAFFYVEPDKIEFVGSLSPHGFVSEHLTCTKNMVEEASCYTNFIIINTTGYIKGQEAYQLKFLKVRLLRPTTIVAIQEKNELEDLLKLFSCHPRLTLYRLRKSKKVLKRSKQMRADFRNFLFREYFSKFYKINLRVGNVHLKERELVGLLDKNLVTVSLGVITKLDKLKMEVITPLKNIRDLWSIKPSSILIDKEVLGV